MSRFALVVARFDGDPLEALLSKMKALGHAETDASSAFVAIDVRVGKWDDGDCTVVVVEGRGATQTAAESIATHFAGRGARVTSGFVHVTPSKGARNVAVDVRTYDGGTCTLDQGARDHVDELLAVMDGEGGAKRSEHEEWLEAFLLDKLPVPVGPRHAAVAVVASECVSIGRLWLSRPSRIAPLLDAIRSGAHAELLQVQGRPAVKLKTADGARISVLDDAERQEVEAALRDRPV